MFGIFSLPVVTNNIFKSLNINDTCTSFVCFKYQFTQSYVLVVPHACRIDLWTMSITALVVIFSAPMPKSPGGLI